MVLARYLAGWLPVARTLRVRGRHPECAAYRKRNRAGAVFSLELLLVLPILLTVCFGLVELSLLLMGMQRVQSASSAACRVATLPTTDSVAQQQAMSNAAAAALHTPGLVATYQMKSQVGQYAGDPVVVEVSVPMTAAAPDLLKMIGFSLRGRQMTAQTQMCKQ
jgi:hypothetical protein